MTTKVVIIYSLSIFRVFSLCKFITNNMKSFLYIIAFAASVLIVFLSNAKGVPQAVTKAPGESGFDCGACHSGGNFNTSITLHVKDSSGNIVTQYEPDKTYQLEVMVTGQNNAKSYGFQMVALSDSDNKDQGRWTNLGTNVKTQNMLQRKYILQSNPRQDGIFTATWQAPPTDLGSVSFYFSGLAVNLNGSNTGDSPVSSKLTLPSSTISSLSDFHLNVVKIFPNPARNIIYISSSENVQPLGIFNSQGQKMSVNLTDPEKGIDISALPAGLYFLQHQGVFPHTVQTRSFIKD